MELARHAVSEHKSGLAVLPPELVLYILQALDLSSLEAAIGAAPSFRNVWQSHHAAISAGVISSSIECYCEALKLEETARPVSFEGSEAALGRVRRIDHAAACVTAGHDLFVQDYLKEYTIGQQLHASYKENEQDRIAIKRVLYWFWALTLNVRSKQVSMVRPLQLPSEVDMYILSALLIWIRREAYRCLCTTLSRAHKVYGHGISRGRWSEQERWQVCSQQLWEDQECRKIRKEHWEENQKTPWIEPSLRVNWFQRRTLTGFFLDGKREILHHQRSSNDAVTVAI